MIKVDRKHFVNDETFHSPYADMPRPIGYNTTISAPGVHAETL
jgi:protein-L-isoaspartate O-methyltransferase